MQKLILSAYLSCALLIPAQASERESCFECPVQPSVLLQASAAPGGLAAAKAAEDGPRRLLALISQYAQAQSSFDVEGLKAATADTFIEVSPVGEVDSREKVLGFYASGKKSPGPTLKIDDQDTRIFGNTAVVLTRMTYSLKGPDGQERQQALRACYVAYKQQDKWKLVSAQYTPIRQR